MSSISSENEENYFKDLYYEGYSHILIPNKINEILINNLIEIFSILTLLIYEQIYFFYKSFDPITFNFNIESNDLESYDLESSIEYNILIKLKKYCILRGITYNHFYELIKFYNININKNNYYKIYNNNEKNNIYNIYNELNNNKNEIIFNCDYFELYNIIYLNENIIKNRLENNKYSQELIIKKYKK